MRKSARAHREVEIRELERLAADMRRCGGRRRSWRGVPQEELFGAVTAEVGRVLVVNTAAMSRYEPDRTLNSRPRDWPPRASWLETWMLRRGSGTGGAKPTGPGSAIN